MAYGFYQVGQSNRARRAEKHEHYGARAALVPFLQVRGRGWLRGECVVVSGWVSFGWAAAARAHAGPGRPSGCPSPV